MMMITVVVVVVVVVVVIVTLVLITITIYKATVQLSMEWFSNPNAEVRETAVKVVVCH